MSAENEEQSRPAGDDARNVHQENGGHATPLPVIDRGVRIRCLRLLGATRAYEVDFRADSGACNPLSIVAGPTNTGKTSVLRFIAYALGGSDYPRHPEVLRQVRSVALEIQTRDGLFTVERALAANRALIFPSELDKIDDITSTTYVVEPTSDLNSISQFMLSTIGLQDVDLKEAPTQDESSTDRLSFRDVMWVCLYLNERIGSQQLLHAGNIQKAIKLRQVVDAIFGVHDNDEADLARRIKEAQAALEQQRRSVELLQEFVSQQEPKSTERLEADAQDVETELSAVVRQLRQLDQREAAASAFASELRDYHASLASKASRSDAKVRARISLIDRFGSLRAQYADDIRKLTLLVEAESVFNQLAVEICPACMNPLRHPPSQDDGFCSLCSQSVDSAGVSAGTADDGSASDAVARAQHELRAAKRRYRELDDYWQRLSEELKELRTQAAADSDAERDASVRLDEATRTAVTPFLGERNELQARRQVILVRRNEVTNGLKLRKGLEAKLADLSRAQRNLELLRHEQRENKDRPDKSAVLSRISERYRDILLEIRYPKADEYGVLPPYIDKNLVPYVRDQHFREASSGGQVLISLAWALAIFEVAYETNAAHPGFLMIDTPQKNLGGAAGDTQFADIHLVERVYRHINHWLSNEGSGAQVIIVDNTPPDLAAEHIVVRYTRDPDLAPFGLIDNEIGQTEDDASADS